MGLGTGIFAMQVRMSGPSRAGNAYALGGQYAGFIAAALVGLTTLIGMGIIALSVLSSVGLAELFRALG